MAIDDGLRDRTRGLLAAYLRGEPSADLVDGPAAIRCGTAVLYVRLVDAEPAVLRVFSPLLRELERSPELLIELNDINARLSFLRMFWRDHTVYAAAELLAHTLDAEELRHTCETLADAADYFDELLSARFGGKTAYAERR